MRTPPFTHPWPAPVAREFAGRHVRLRPLNPDLDAAALHAAAQQSPADNTIWKYLPEGPFQDPSALGELLRRLSATPDMVPFTVREADGPRTLGMLAIMSIVPAHGRAEIGWVWYTRSVQRSPVNTECVYLLLRHLFDDLGYRRVEWKCDALNQPSARAAVRLGFSPEGLFRQHMVIKSQNRDTLWFSMLDSEWPSRKAAFERYLAGPAGESLSRLNGVTPAAPPPGARGANAGA